MLRCVPIKDPRDTAAFDEIISNSPTPIVVTKNGYDRFVRIRSSDFDRWEQADARTQLLERIMASEKERAEGLNSDAFEAADSLRANMAYNVKVQPTALRKLENIVAYLSTFGPNTAADFLDEWKDVLNELSDGIVKHRLSRFDALARLGYHVVLMKKYVVFYFKESDRVVIAHLFRQSQDYANIVLNGI